MIDEKTSSPTYPRLGTSFLLVCVQNFDLENGNLSVRFELCDRALCLTIVQGPGETMFVPSGWHHQVHNEADTLSVNHNWFTSASLNRTAEFLLQESHAVRTALADLRPSATDANTGAMDMAERGWMEQCERLQEANAAMGLGDFLHMLDIFSIESARNISENANTDATAEGVGRETSNKWRAAHELEVVASVTKQLQQDRFVAGCSELSTLARFILDRIEETLCSPEAAEACRQLRVHKMRYTRDNGRPDRKSRPVTVKLEVARGGRCKLVIDLGSAASATTY